jgi:peptide-methionine (S)-S-oxide reductase
MEKIMRQLFLKIMLSCTTMFITNLYADEAIFGMGCFWSAESEFRNSDTNAVLPGISAIRVGYAGGTMPNPTYENHSGYKEAVKIEYDPKIISYAKLLDLFWHNIDPFDLNGQFCDKGDPYSSVIFYNTVPQESAAKASKISAENQLRRKIVTEIIPVTTFYDAEEQHQNFSYKNPQIYKTYRWGCGRDKKLQEIWQQ